MNNRSATHIDEHVGNRMRTRRILVGMSQEKLGEKLGLTFQQIQKYERATNRISASRLYEIARILGVQVSFFFEGLEPEGEGSGLTEDSASYSTDMITTAEGIRLNRDFNRIANSGTQKSLLQLVNALAEKAQDED